MEQLFFESENFEKLYSCKQFHTEEWYTFGKPNLFIAVLYIMTGVIFEVSRLKSPESPALLFSHFQTKNIQEYKLFAKL